MDPNTTIADQNTERLIQAAYQPEPVPAPFAANLDKLLTATAHAIAQQPTTPPPALPNRWRTAALVLGGIAACGLIAYAMSNIQRPIEHPDPRKSIRLSHGSFHHAPLPTPMTVANWTSDVREGMQPRVRPNGPALATLNKGAALATKPGKPQLVVLDDGTKLYVNEKTEVEASGDRQLTLHKGQIYLEVAPRDDAAKFVVKAAGREMTATGTHFAVQSDAVASGFVVTQGKVAVKGIDQEVTSGQRIAPGAFAVTSAPRASHTLEWTRELMAAAESPMVPGCQHAGGALLALDPQGQEIKLSLRQYHIDVHIEDGFARTTIDQTYFNTTWDRLEGTFYFPLPADASLSRLAMYVVDGNQCKLMEGGMAERKHAADVYETIRYQRRDPALLEWLDGSTFKMRVFPLEAKQEKRIVLSYTQKLPSLYGNTRYRFAGGHNMPLVRDWSFTARIKSGAGMSVWSPSHENMHRIPQTGDVLMTFHNRNVKPEEDVVLEMQEPAAVHDQDLPRFASFLYENHQYLMLRYRPTLPSMPERKRRDWIILFEASAQRDPLLAGTQVDVVRQLLKNAEYDDTFTLLTVNGRVNLFNDKPQPARPKNVDDAIHFLQKTHLVGALDLQQGLQAALKLAKDAKNPHILHVGSGIPAMGERDASKLAQLLPSSATYVGVGVGKRWNRSFMKSAAERTNGVFTQINPDEVISWRAFELLATLNTPRLLDLQVVDAFDKSTTKFLLETTMLAQGEEICAVTRVDTSRTAIPGKVFVKGTLDGKAFVKEFPVMNVLSGAGYLPRTWAKQEIDRLLAENAAKHKNEIVNLSKAMYVMSPFTSLLVLETDADYEKYKVDKGRKDHWAMYQCPPKIPLVFEPEGKTPPLEAKKIDKKDRKPSVGEVLGTMAPSRTWAGSLNNQTDRIRVLGMMNNTELESLSWLDDTAAGMNGTPARPRKEDGEYYLEVFGRPQVINSPLALDFAFPAGTSNGDVDRKKLSVFNNTSAGGSLPSGLQRPGLDGLSNKDKAKAEQDERVRRRQRLFNELEDRIDPQSEAIQGLKRPPAANNWGLTMGIEFAFDKPLKMPEFNLPAPVPPPVGFGGELLGEEKKREMNGRGFDPRNGLLMGIPVGNVTNTFTPDGGTMVSGGLRLSEEGKMISDHIPIRNSSFNFTASLRYERPAFSYDRTRFTDLVQYAPGLHTGYADILAALEREAEVESPKAGTIDAAARQLIDKARAADWTSLAIAAQGPIPGYKIAFNGLGQFAYERLLVSGLREQVVCDGKTLWHLYPEIGLASKRPMSRHYQHLIASIHPAFVPGADELARGFDVKAIDATTIALIPIALQAAPSGGGPEKHHRVHLVFTKDGRLSERRIVEMPLGKVVAKQLYHADGSVEWKDADDKSVAKVERTIAPAQAPDLQANTRELVVMEMPIRTRAYWLDRWSKDEKPYYIEQVIVSDCVTRSVGALSLIQFGNHIHEKGDRRLGFYTLLNSAGFPIVNENLPQLDKKAWTIDIEQEHPQSALAMFLAQEQRELKANDQSLVKKMVGPKDGFIQRLTQFRNLWLTWQNQRPLMNSGAEMPIEKAKVLEFMQATTSPTFAYAILDTMQRRCNTPPSDHMMNVVEKRFGPISDPVGLGYLFRYEQARSLWQAGIGAEAGKRFRGLHADTLKNGVLPPIDPAFRDALQMQVEGAPRFIAFTRQALDELLSKKRYSLAFQMAKQMEQLGDEALSDEILTAILTKASAEERNTLTLVCVNFFAQRKNFVQADRLLVKVLEDKKLSQNPELWRWRSALTKDAGQTATSIACLEKSLDLEYADLPELVNLQSIREDYAMLLAHYQKIAEASASLEKSATKTFLAKVIRTTDRWRLLDPDASPPSMLAGKILHTMGERELAWDYWTTPIDLHPAESRPWLDLAETMKTEGDLDKADRAFQVAFEAEQSNPEILWKRAQNAVRMGQPDRARQLYRQIADSDWQERFQATVEQARGLAGQ